MAGDLDPQWSRPRALPRSSAFLALMSRARLARSWACSQVIMDSPRGCSSVSCVCGGERVAPALLSPQVEAPLRGGGCGHRPGERLPRERPPRTAHSAPAEERGSRVGPRPAQGHATTWGPRGWGGRPSPPSAPLTSRRLRSAGCSRKERLSRYCHRGLSSGGSRRFSRRDRREEHRLPAGRGAGSGPATPERPG